MLLNNFAPDETLHNSEAFLLSFSSLNFTSYFSIYFVRFVQKNVQQQKVFFSLSINSLFIFLFCQSRLFLPLSLASSPLSNEESETDIFTCIFPFFFCISLSLSLSLSLLNTLKHRSTVNILILNFNWYTKLGPFSFLLHYLYLYLNTNFHIGIRCDRKIISMFSNH